MRYLFLQLCVAVFALSAFQAQAAPEPAPPPLAKFALVIGNASYSPTKRSLKNPVNDARLMADTLSKLGFSVKQVLDADRSQMVSAVAEFADQLPAGATSFVFFAGHGMQIGGASYLLPVDMQVSTEQSVPIRAYPLRRLLERVSASKAGINMVVLDACRDNPFQPAPATRYRGFSDLGLGPVVAPRGTFVAYSTSPGQLAADGKDANSVYTATLARALLEPKMPLEQIFRKVGDQVRKITLDDQIPWFESSVNEDFYFLPPDGIKVVAGRSLRVADASRQSTANGQRSVRSTGPSTEPLWYRSMGDYEWSKLDFDIQQRVKYMTLDEVPLMEHRAKGGSVVAQMTLGLFWREGASRISTSGGGKVQRYQSNNTKAVVWLRKAAAAGFPIAQTELGEMLFRGHGIDRDPNEARQLLESASEANYPRAKLDLFQINMEEGKASANDMQSVMESLMRGTMPTKNGR
jgi:hypothetical protein